MLCGDISPMVLGDETSRGGGGVHAFSFLLSMAITRVLRRSFAELLAHGGAALAMHKCVLRESIGRLKKPRRTKYHFNIRLVKVIKLHAL